MPHNKKHKSEMRLLYTSPSWDNSAVQHNKIFQPHMSSSAWRSGPAFLLFLQIFSYPGALKSFRGVWEAEQRSGGSCSCRNLVNTKPKGVLFSPLQLVLPSNIIWRVSLDGFWSLVVLTSTYFFLKTFDNWRNMCPYSQLVFYFL